MREPQLELSLPYSMTSKDGGPAKELFIASQIQHKPAYIKQYLDKANQ